MHGFTWTNDGKKMGGFITRYMLNNMVCLSLYGITATTVFYIVTKNEGKNRLHAMPLLSNREGNLLDRAHLQELSQ